MPKKRKKTWGGARRKPSKDPAIKVSVSIPASLVEELDTQAAASTGNRSEVVVRLLRDALEDNRKKTG